jgi:CRP-like cAMP-binding protein
MYLQRYVSIPPEDQQIIVDAFSSRTYKANSFLSRAGEKADTLYFINRGMIKITIPQDEEKVATYYFMTENQFVALLYSYYGNIPAKQHLQAVDDAEVFKISMTDLEKLYERMSYLKETISQIAQLSMAEMINIKNTYLGLTAAQKYVKLLELQPEVARTAPLMDIASYLDITPQSLSRVRKQMFSQPKQTGDKQ